MPRSPAHNEDDFHRAAADQADLHHHVGTTGRLPQPQGPRGAAAGMPLAAGWGPMLARASKDLALAPRLKELALCAVSVLNGADEELHHHGPLLLAGGAGAAQLAALRALPALPADDDTAWTALERSTLRLCVEMTAPGADKVSDAAFNAARQALGNDELLFELIGVIGTQHMVTRALLSTSSSVSN